MIAPDCPCTKIGRWIYTEISMCVDVYTQGVSGTSEDDLGTATAAAGGGGFGGYR